MLLVLDGVARVIGAFTLFGLVVGAVLGCVIGVAVGLAAALTGTLPR